MGKALQQEIINRPILSSWQEVLNYCHATMAFLQTETLRLLFLDTKNHLIRDEGQPSGTVGHIALYPREVIRRALELGASALIIVHNHPSGDPTPSQEDINLTLKIQEAAKPLGIKVHDHLIIGNGRHCSLKSMGLI